MAEYKSEFLQIMRERGFIHQCTNDEALDRRLKKERTSAYIGFDCTAASLHVGSLIQLMALRWLQKTGHKPIVLLGGGTTKVGDPSGKDETRKLIQPETITSNAESIQKIIERFLTVGTGATDAIIINNDDWLKDLNYIDFMRNFGRHFSVNRMLTQDSVKLRLEREQNLSFLEFNYMILQAYDFVELNKRYGCMLQIGGSDQWGNIVMGIDLHRRLDAENRFQPMEIDSKKKKGLKVLEVQPIIQSKRTDPDDYAPGAFMRYVSQTNDKDLFGMTTPLLTTAAGEKMGKTATGAVWLNKELLPAYEYWQFWRNTEDADVGRFLRLFTELPIKEIEKLEALKGADINDAKKVLATECTKLAHGDRAARQAAETAKKVFEEGKSGKDTPVYEMPESELGKGLPAYEMLRISGMAKSGGEARRLIRGGGARLNDQKIEDENDLVGHNHFHNGQLKLSSGKKKHLIVKLS